MKQSRLGRSLELEIHFFEAHTAHADEECATRQIQQDLRLLTT